MKRLLIGAAALTVICSAMLVTARLGGSLNKPLGMSILEANVCDPQPCWQSIRPGEISPDQAMTNLRRSGALLTTTDGKPCWYMLSAPFWLSCVSGVRLPPGDLRLGDALLQFGEPIGLGLCHVVNSQLPSLPQRFVGAFISFRHGVRLEVHPDGHVTQERVLPVSILVSAQVQDTQEQTEKGWRDVQHWSCLG